MIARSLTDEIERDAEAGADADGASVVHVRLLEISALLDYLLRRQLLSELTRHVIASPETATRSATQPAAAIFADLVGLTSLTEQLEDEELAALASRFQSVAFDLVATGEGASRSSVTALWPCVRTSTSWVAKPSEADSAEMTDVTRDGFYAALLDDDAEDLY